MSYKWKPLVRATHLYGEPREVTEAVMQSLGMNEADAIAWLEAQDRELKTEYWVNDLYQVCVCHFPDSKIVQLNIRRRDGAPCIRDWRHFQQIKNELVGEDCEGIEIYPAESRKVDTSNKYHIWCIKDPTFRFPFGFGDRAVVENEVKRPAGIRQRGT